MIGQSIQKIVLLTGILGGMFWLKLATGLHDFLMLIITIIIMQSISAAPLAMVSTAREAQYCLISIISSVKRCKALPIIQSLVQEATFCR